LNRGHPLANGLVLAMPFYEQAGSTVYDLSGQGNHGDFNGDPTWINTPFGGGIDFDGTDDYIEMPESQSLDVTGDKITVSVWVRFDSIGNIGIITKRDAFNSDNAYNIFIDSAGHFNFTLTHDGSTRIVAEYSTTSVVRVWYFAVGVYDGSNVHIYINADLKDSTPTTGNIYNSSIPLRIGSINDPPASFLNGIVDNAMIWNRALSQIEISQLYHDPFCMFRPPNRIVYNIPFSYPLTDDVYHAIRHMLTTQDKLSWGNDVDAGNLKTQREFWKIGRQVEKQNKSSKYLKELVKQSFIGMFPTRKGLRGFSAWRAFASGDEVATHDESKILHVLEYTETEISKVYNDFTINYDHNPERKKFNKSLFITKTDDPGDKGFPSATESAKPELDITRSDFSSMLVTYNGSEWFIKAEFTNNPYPWAKVGEYIRYDDGAGNTIYQAEIIGVWAGAKMVTCKFINTFGIAKGTYSGGTFKSMGSSVLAWTTYVGGISDYTTAKAWWTICHLSYERTQVVNPLPKSLGDCYWFPDNNDFEAGSGGMGDAAVYYLQNLVEWTTRKKFMVQYELPITAANIQLEILDPIIFNDQKYTNDVDRFGWITNIKIIPAETKIEITAILEPFDIETDDLIIETGSAPDTITEAGDNADTITEGAQ
jgi:hypothetical protein